MVFVRRLDELFHIKLSLNQREKLRGVNVLCLRVTVF